MAQELKGLGRELIGLEKEWETIRKHAGPALRSLTDSPEYGRIARYLSFVELRTPRPHSSSKRGSSPPTTPAQRLATTDTE